jgi:hypothetical protein
VESQLVAAFGADPELFREFYLRYLWRSFHYLTSDQDKSF